MNEGMFGGGGEDVRGDFDGLFDSVRHLQCGHCKGVNYKMIYSY